MNSHSPYFSKLILRLSSVAVITSVSACQTNSTAQIVKRPHMKLTPSVHTPPPAPIKTAPQAILPTKLHRPSHQGTQFNIVTFDSRSQHLVVADQPNGPGSKWSDSKAAAKAHNGIAAINAGFFTPEGKPLGLVISKGKKLGSYTSSSLGSGIFHHNTSGAGAKISRRAIWSDLSNNPPAELLQAGPMLLENSKTISGLSSKSARPRSFLATDGKNHWCIGHADSCTLPQLSKALSTLKISGFNPTTALNLDGGRSSDLWVSSSITPENEGSKEIRPFWNKPVRNFLILKSN